MFFVSIRRPTKAQEQAVCSKGSSLGFNFNSAGSSITAPPLPAAAEQDGWWNVDHERIKIGYGKKTYEATKNLLNNWGQFQLPWAHVDPTTPVQQGSNVCVAARVFGVWTAVPLQIVYKQEGRWQQNQDAGSSSSSSGEKQRRRRHGQQMSYAHACLHTHYLAGEERFKVEWDKSDDSVWYDLYTFSRPHHPLAFLGYPVVRILQQQFKQQSMRAVARAAAVHTVDQCLDDATKRRIELYETRIIAQAGQDSKKKVFGVFGSW